MNNSAVNLAQLKQREPLMGGECSNKDKKTHFCSTVALSVIGYFN